MYLSPFTSLKFTIKVCFFKLQILKNKNNGRDNWNAILEQKAEDSKENGEASQFVSQDSPEANEQGSVQTEAKQEDWVKVSAGVTVRSWGPLWPSAQPGDFLPSPPQ